jgi:hypothetical protein
MDRRVGAWPRPGSGFGGWGTGRARPQHAVETWAREAPAPACVAHLGGVGLVFDGFDPAVAPAPLLAR